MIPHRFARPTETQRAVFDLEAARSERDRQRAELREHVADYLTCGKQITQVPIGATAQTDVMYNNVKRCDVPNKKPHSKKAQSESAAPAHAHRKNKYTKNIEKWNQGGRLITARQAAQLVGKNPNNFSEMVRTKRLPLTPVKREAGYLWFERAQVLAYINQQATQ